MSRAILLTLFLIIAVALVGLSPAHAQKDDNPRGADLEGEERDDPRPRELERELLPRSLEGPIDPATYILGPADELLLIVRGPQSKVHHLVVLPEGNVILPNIGSTPAAGKTLVDFRDELRKVLAKYYRNVDIDVQLARPRRFVVFVVGEVEQPQPVEVSAPFRVSQAVTLAGGVASNGSQRAIEIRKDGETLRTVDLFMFFHTGDFDHNPMLQEGQSLYVPPQRLMATIVGEIRAPGTFEILAGETAADLISFGDGLRGIANSDDMLLERMIKGQVQPPIKFSLDQAASMELHDLDNIIVRDVVSFNGKKPVRVAGGGGRTGTIRLEDAEPLAEFLHRLWRFQPSGYQIELGVLEREASGEDSLYVFDVRAVLGGDPAGETLVYPGDFISFPPADETIFVAGEVTEPGAVPFLPGFTAEYYIVRAGGPTQDGTFDRLEIYSVDGVERGGDRSTIIYRGDTVVVKRSKSRIFGSLFVGVTSLTGIVLSIIALSK